MGWPLTGVAALVTYLAIRTAQRALHEQEATEAEPTTGAPEAPAEPETTEARTD
jgi:hypothetical protein